jgi:hypothetical protein
MSASEQLDQRFVTFVGGLTVPLEAVQLVLAIEARGVRMEHDGGDILLHQPAERVTAAERRDLARLKPYVLALITYCSEEVEH